MTGSARLGRHRVENSSSVEIEAIDLPGDGRIFVADDVIDNGDGTWNYEYTIYNLTSELYGQRLLGRQASVTVLDREFHDAPSRSGEPGLQLGPEHRVRLPRLGTTEHSVDENANAIRWGTMYNFTIVADARRPKVPPGSDPPTTAPSRCPSGCPPVPATRTHQRRRHRQRADAGLFIALWGTDDPAGDFNGDGIVNGIDAGLFFANWGPPRAGSRPGDPRTVKAGGPEGAPSSSCDLDRPEPRSSIERRRR